MKNNLLLLSFITLLFISCQGDKEAAQLKKELSQKSDTIKLLRQYNDTMLQAMDSMHYEATKWFSDSELAYFKELGISNPEEFITDDLLGKPQLIPYKGVLGGTMRIYDVTLLGNQWAIAYFEDGHVAGKMLLKYTVSGDRKIKWKVMDSYME